MLLLIEDEAITRTAMAESLRNSGEVVLEPANGEEALALLQDNPVKLVVMDFVLPGVDGLKLMDLIHQRRPKLPIILISGYLS
jgi:CheY-like chemotaxis protein